MKYSLRSLMVVVLLSGPAIWYGWRQFGGYREAEAAAQIAEMRWQELQAARATVLKSPTVRAQAGERHAQLRYARDRRIAAEKSARCFVPISLPPAP
jgi:hypothetical protein